MRVWGSFLIAAAALKTPTRNGYTAQGVNLNIYVYPDLSLYLYIHMYITELSRFLGRRKHCADGLEVRVVYI